MKIAVVIPTYNEAKNIAKLVAAVNQLLKNGVIIVVDDNSPDGTADLVFKLRKKFPSLYLIKRSGKTGRGSAVIAGFKLALEKIKADIFIEMDADLSHDPKELLGLIKLSQPKTVVLASRYLPKSKIINWPSRRVISSRMANFLIRLVLGLPTKDNTNGYRCYQKEAVKILVNYKFLSRGYILLSESEKLLYKNGFKLIEVPSIFRNRRLGQSKASFSEFFYSLLLLIRIRLKIG